MFMASTYKNVADLVKEKGLAGATLHLSVEVTGIHWTHDIQGSHDQVEVRLADGTAAAFDEVVITVPLGFLKLNKHIFTPPLSSDLSDAIDHIGWGHLERAWVTFPSAFWDTNSTSASYKWPAETHFLRPEYTPFTNPKGWNQEMMSLSAIPPPFSFPTLRFSMYGEFSKETTERIRDLDPYSKEYYDVLDTFFKPYYSKLPNYDESSEQSSANQQPLNAVPGSTIAGRDMARTRIFRLVWSMRIEISRRIELVWGLNGVYGLRVKQLRHLRLWGLLLGRI
jgi:hypothetical protein